MSLTRVQWALMPRILKAISNEPGLTEQVLVKHLNANAADVHHAVAVLIRQGKLDPCSAGFESYLTLPLPRRGGDAA